ARSRDESARSSPDAPKRTAGERRGRVYAKVRPATGSWRGSYPRSGGSMSDLQTIADRVEIEALRGEFTDAILMRDWDRFASLFTEDGAWRMPHIPEELVGRDQIRAGIERLQGLWDYFVQTAHPGTITIDDDTAVGRAYVSEFGHMRDGISYSNYAIY